jgi:hypothetical protein
MVRGRLTGNQCVKALRRAVRDKNRAEGTSYRVVPRAFLGHGSYEFWSVVDEANHDKEIAKGKTTSHMGEGVIKDFEQRFEILFGKGWLR